LEGLRVYRDLLANRPLAKLLFGEFVSGIGDWLYIVAIFIVIYRDSHDAAAVGAFGGLRLVPYILLSVPAGFVADRFDRRLVLLASDIFRGSTMLVLAWLTIIHGPVWLISAVAISAAGGSAFFYPAIGAYLPSLVKDERQLGPANSAWASLGNLSFIVGPAIGGVLIAVAGVLSAFLLNAATFVVIAVILWTLPPSIGKARGHETAAESATAAEPATAAAAAPTTPGAAEAAAATEVEVAMAGVPPTPASAQPTTMPPSGMPANGPTVAVRPLAGLTVVQLMAGFLGGGLQALTVILAIEVLHAGEDANGYLNAAIGVGGLLGAIGSGALVLRRALGMPLLVGAVITGLGTVVLGAATGLGLALLAIAVVSAGSMVIDVVTTTLFQRLVPDELRGRGTGLLMTAQTVTGAIGAFVLPVLVIGVGVFPSLAVAGVAVIIVTAVGLALIGSAATREPSPFEATLARAAELPLFAGVPASRLEAALHRLQAVPVAAGQTIVRQGQPADRFYIIESGTFTVTQEPTPGAPPVVLRQLGPDQVFGEIGLLNKSPRTATVTADTDGVLLALEGRDFLALVGASGALRQRLQGLYAGAGGGGSA
jgi:MFS family permease